MKKNPSKVDAKVVKIHKTKIETLIGNEWYPKEGLGPEEDFKNMEHWVGHDLSVQSIVFYTNNAKNKMVFFETDTKTSMLNSKLKKWLRIGPSRISFYFVSRQGERFGQRNL
jgi:hypothetical protein